MRARLAGLILISLAPTARAAPTVSLLTMTPGERLFERFGHTAIRVGDRVYNYGTFNPDDPELVRKFLAWRLEYWLSVGTYEAHLARYGDRVITEQELALRDEEAADLAAALEENARPERRAYRYDFFADNCATRVRDLVDRAVEGEISRSVGGAPGHATLRRHVERVLGDGVTADAVSMLLNATVDEKPTRWGDAFLPEELASLVREARRKNGQPIVRVERTIVGPRVARPAPGSRIPELLVGGALVALLLACGVFGRHHRLLRRLTGAALALAGLALGAIGVALAVASATPHPCAHANASLVALSPATLALLILGVAMARDRATASWLRAIPLLLALPPAFDLAAHAVGWGSQAHLGLVASSLLLELCVGVSLLAYRR